MRWWVSEVEIVACDLGHGAEVVVVRLWPMKRSESSDGGAEGILRRNEKRYLIQ